MNIIDEIIQEHEKIERELLEIEFISNSEIINYPNLKHVLNNLCQMWNPHEEKEEKIFPILEKEKIKIPVEKILCEHKALKNHKNVLIRALASGSEFEMKKALLSDGKIIVEKLRKHIKDEDDVLCTISLDELSPEALKQLDDLE